LNRSIILKTTDGGVSWVRQNIIASSDLLDIHFINENTGVVAGFYGTILRTTTAGEPIGINKIGSEFPVNYTLSQNYPNPFNPVTNIKFDLPKESFVKLIVYDILGRELESIVNEDLVEGVYEVSWDASNYSSGIYIYKLEVEDFVESKKMVLIK